MAKFLDLTGLSQFKNKIQEWSNGAFVAKVSGKGLSSNDYTTTEKNKLAGLTATTIDIVKVNGTPLTPDGSKAVNIDLAKYAIKTEVTQEIAEAVSGIQGFDAQVVASLPETGKKGILYLVANSGSGQNSYDEYLWITDKYEKLGTRDIDLSKYALKSEIPTSISQLANDSGFQTASQVETAITSKGYISEIPDEYVTDTELSGKGYQTSAQVESAITSKGYQTESQVAAAIEESQPTAITETEIDDLFTE